MQNMRIPSLLKTSKPKEKKMILLIHDNAQLKQSLCVIFFNSCKWREYNLKWMVSTSENLKNAKQFLKYFMPFEEIVTHK